MYYEFNLFKFLSIYKYNIEILFIFKLCKMYEYLWLQWTKKFDFHEIFIKYNFSFYFYFIIGSKGSTIKKLMKETKTYIKIPQGDKQDISIIGHNERVSKLWLYYYFEFYLFKNIILGHS